MSDDELGGYDPTTPKPTAPAPRAQPKARPVNRAPAAGPSSKQPAVAAGPSKASTSKTTPQPDITILSSDEEEGPSIAAATVKNKGKASATIASPRSKTAEKAKLKPSANGKVNVSADVEMNEPEEEHAAEHAKPPPRPARTSRPGPAPKPAGAANARPQRSASDTTLEQENARLRKRLEAVTSQRDKLSAQLEEAFQIRNTEPEQALQDGIEQLNQTLRAQELLIQEQTSKLAAYGALSNSNHSVQFLSREAAEEERKDLGMKLRKLEQTIREKDAAIAELDAKHHDLEKQLAAEIEMAKEYRSKNALVPKVNNGPKALPSSSAADPLQCEVVKLYEDLSNFLVTNVTRNPPPFPDWPELQEYTFNCTYTHLDPARGNGPNPSLQFNLRSTWMREGDTSVNDDERVVVSSKDELQAKIQYWPLNLDMEKEEFRNRLEFFGDSFVFAREQMHVFLRTLSERLSATLEELEDEEMDQVEDEVTAP